MQNSEDLDSALSRSGGILRAQDLNITSCVIMGTYIGGTVAGTFPGLSIQSEATNTVSGSTTPSLVLWLWYQEILSYAEQRILHIAGNPRRYTGSPRVGTMREIARMCEYVQSNYHKGEPDENADIVMGDMRAWIDERVEKYGPKSNNGESKGD
ncbi:hypothetical protein RHMOL_Rhmol08G0291400 [Rhododendron molle]|uniref:Uncharacterized protein n=1 Tax=Rhododendron molle TaxID=49168 RepID=A0ACC0MVR7_RHOML|nr:hypothetical protein RHMOL_Rhmol08G0291400 [Rhododendron molle]